MATLDRRGRVAGRAGVRDMGGDDRDRAGFIIETLMLTPYGIREGRTRLSCRSWPTEAAAKQTMEAYAAVFHRIDSLGHAPSYVTVTLNAWNCPGQAALDIFPAERNDYEATQGILALVGGDTRLRHQWSGPKLNPALIDADLNHQSLGVGSQIINPSFEFLSKRCSGVTHYRSFGSPDRRGMSSTPYDSHKSHWGLGL